MAQEKQFENKIKKYLADRGHYHVKYFANRMTKVGVPDILACVNGYFVGIEVKSSTGKPSDLQIHNVEKIIESFGFAVIVSPEQWGDLTKMIDNLNMSETLIAERLMERINSKFF